MGKKYKMLTSIIVIAMILSLGGCSEEDMAKTITEMMPYETTDIANYRENLARPSTNDLKIFPQDIPVSAEEIDYYYYIFWGIYLNPSVQSYLHCQYSAEDYEKEVERLQDMKNKHQTKADEAYMPDNCGKEIFVHEYDIADRYQYAIADGETHTIVYVYLQYITNKDDVYFDQKYLMKGIYDDQS